jgi:hypothetical protein
MQGRQQHIVAQSINGITYPIQLKVRNTIHNLRAMKHGIILKTF